jgi:hypothetical protein
MHQMTLSSASQTAINVSKPQLGNGGPNHVTHDGIAYAVGIQDISRLAVLGAWHGPANKYEAIMTIYTAVCADADSTPTQGHYKPTHAPNHVGVAVQKDDDRNDEQREHDPSARRGSQHCCHLSCQVHAY